MLDDGPSAPTPFIVFTSCRSGSEWLIDTLASHPHLKAELVENLDELRTQLAGTRFEWMLGDPA